MKRTIGNLLLAAWYLLRWVFTGKRPEDMD